MFTLNGLALTALTITWVLWTLLVIELVSLKIAIHYWKRLFAIWATADAKYYFTLSDGIDKEATKINKAYGNSPWVSFLRFGGLRDAIAIKRLYKQSAIRLKEYTILAHTSRG